MWQISPAWVAFIHKSTNSSLNSWENPPQKKDAHLTTSKQTFFCGCLFLSISQTNGWRAVTFKSKEEEEKIKKEKKNKKNTTRYILYTWRFFINERLRMKNSLLLPPYRWRSSQRRWPAKRLSPWPPEPLPGPMLGLGAMAPRGGPLPSRSLIIPGPTTPRGPPAPRSLRLMSRRSSPRISRSRTALVFFSSTFRRTSPRNMMGCRERQELRHRRVTHKSHFLNTIN